MITRFLAPLFLIFCLALPLAAQEPEAPDYSAWESFAENSEATIETPDVTEADLGEVRRDLVTWREIFLSAEGTNAARIETLKAQIEALGPVPAEGETEAEDIAARRKELNAQLEKSQAPGLAAEEAYTRANGMIGEIDKILLDRQAKAFTQLGPSPLNPTLWPDAVSAFAASATRAWGHLRDKFDNQKAWEDLRSGGLPLVGYLAVALMLVVRGASWSRRFTGFVRGRVSGSAGKGVGGFFASLAQIGVPVAGLVAITLAAAQSGLLGPRGMVLFNALPQIGVALFFWRWLAGRLFSAVGEEKPILDLNARQRAEATTMGALAGVMAVLERALVSLADLDGYSTETVAVLTFPLIAITAFALFRLGRILLRSLRGKADVEEGDEAQDMGFVKAVLGSIARAVLLISVASLVLGAIGYMSAAKGTVFPLMLSIALFGGVAVLSRFAHDFYAVITGHRETATDALIPVLVSFALILGSLPLFALIWGVRVEQLAEIWSRMKAGVSLGGVTISPSSLFALVLVFSIGYALTRLFKSGLKTVILPKTRLDKGGQNAIVAGAGYVGVFLSVIAAITAAGIDLSALAIVAGALSVGIGFGLQNIVQNFVSGIILLIERPISEGDWIDVGNGQMGFVRDISVRSTRVETFDRTDLIVPNADLISNQVTNYTRGNLIGRLIVPVGVAYGTDTKKVDNILREIAEAHPLIAMTPPPQILFMNFGADSLEFEIRAILRDVNFILSVRNDLHHEIARRFGEEGIEIPFAQRDIWLRNPEVLTQGRSTPETGKGQSYEALRPPKVEDEVSVVELRDIDAAQGDTGDSE